MKNLLIAIVCTYEVFAVGDIFTCKNISPESGVLKDCYNYDRTAHVKEIINATNYVQLCTEQKKKK